LLILSGDEGHYIFHRHDLLDPPEETSTAIELVVPEFSSVSQLAVVLAKKAGGCAGRACLRCREVVELLDEMAV
jgi:hypothetical protein